MCIRDRQVATRYGTSRPPSCQTGRRRRSLAEHVAAGDLVALFLDGRLDRLERHVAGLEIDGHALGVDVHGYRPDTGQGAHRAFDRHLAVIAGDARDVEHCMCLAHDDSSPSAGLPSSASLYVTARPSPWSTVTLSTGASSSTTLPSPPGVVMIAPRLGARLRNDT